MFKKSNLHNILHASKNNVWDDLGKYLGITQSKCLKQESDPNKLLCQLSNKIKLNCYCVFGFLLDLG